MFVGKVLFMIWFSGRYSNRNTGCLNLIEVTVVFEAVNGFVDFRNLLLVET